MDSTLSLLMVSFAACVRSCVASIFILPMALGEKGVPITSTDAAAGVCCTVGDWGMFCCASPGAFVWPTCMGSLASVLALGGEVSLRLDEDELDEEVEGSCLLERSFALSLALSLVAFALLCTPDMACRNDLDIDLADVCLECCLEDFPLLPPLL